MSHEIRDKSDRIVGTFTGQVPRAGDMVWFQPAEMYEPSAAVVIEVCWWVPVGYDVGYENLGDSRACVYVEGPIKSEPNG